MELEQLWKQYSQLLKNAFEDCESGTFARCWEGWRS